MIPWNDRWEELGQAAIRLQCIGVDSGHVFLGLDYGASGAPLLVDEKADPLWAADGNVILPPHEMAPTRVWAGTVDPSGDRIALAVASYPCATLAVDCGVLIVRTPPSVTWTHATVALDGRIDGVYVSAVRAASLTPGSRVVFRSVPVSTAQIVVSAAGISKAIPVRIVAGDEAVVDLPEHL
jgi:hypothetical protein